jgi:TolB-like protein
VLYFERNSNLEELETYRAGLTDMFITELQKIPQLQVVERSRLDGIMGELELGEVGAIDPETAQKIGRLMGAQALYYGSFATGFEMVDGKLAPSKDIRLDGRLVRVETGEILAGGKYESEIEGRKMFQMVEKVSEIIAANINTNHKALVADIFYSKGRTAEEENDRNGAILHYQKALQYYPDHELSKKALERLQT